MLISLVAFVLTFLGATVFNIAAGEPFSPADVLYVHLFVGAPFGIALGLDLADPGLMSRRPRPSSEPIVTGAVKLTAGLAGLHIAACLDALIYLGEKHYRSSVIGSSIGLRAFALMLVVACFESPAFSLSAPARETFDNAQMNWTAAAELAPRS